jgi:hypothetical protein
MEDAAAGRPRNDEKLFKALLELRADPLDPDLPDELLDEMVLAAGGDPKELEAEGWRR